MQSIRLPTMVGYCLVGVGIGMLAACQLFKLHDIIVPDSSLYGYGCHDEDSKPVMRGLLHTLACIVCFITLLVQKWLYGTTRHPSDFVLAYFGMQYFASGMYHRFRLYPSVVSVFTSVDIGWIAATIIGCSMMVKLNKLRHVLYVFLTFVLLCFVAEYLYRGFGQQRYIEAGQWMENVKNIKEGIQDFWFIHSLSFEPWVWVGLKAISGISFALVPFFSPAALQFSSYDFTKKCLFFASFASYMAAFVCFGLQTASRKGVTVHIPWHVNNVWGFHEDFHLILVIAHTFTSQMYDVIYNDDDGGLGIEAFFRTFKQIVGQVESEHRGEFMDFFVENFVQI